MATFGESHGKAMGVVLDGLPAGLTYSVDDLRRELEKRRPGRSKGTSERNESDSPEILSGVLDNLTLGTPIAVIVRNGDTKSSDYHWAEKEFRPGHADRTTMFKYGIRDHRGGGRSSGRETVSRVIAGYFASLVIPEVKLHTKVEQPNVDNLEEYLEELKKAGESCGAVVSVRIKNCPRGLGEPVFDKLKADLAKAMLSIGGCTSFSYGLGVEFASKRGSEVNQEDFGGIEGGISNGEDINLKMTFKPVSTVGKKAREGRHDPSLVPRVLPVIESMIKLVIADHYLRQRAYEGLFNRDN